MAKTYYLCPECGHRQVFEVRGWAMREEASPYVFECRQRGCRYRVNLTQAEAHQAITHGMPARNSSSGR